MASNNVRKINRMDLGNSWSKRKSQIETDVVQSTLNSNRFEGGGGTPGRQQNSQARNGSQTVASISTRRHKSHMRHGSHFGSVGAGIIHGPSFLNVYHNPVINPKRALSKSNFKRKKKSSIVPNEQNLNLTVNDTQAGNPDQ